MKAKTAPKPSKKLKNVEPIEAPITLTTLEIQEKIEFWYKEIDKSTDNTSYQEAWFNYKLYKNMKSPLLTKIM